MSGTPDLELAGRIRQRILSFAVFLGLVLAGSTLGYKLIVGPQNSLFECLYMTVITVTTIGYGEMLDFSHHPAGRWFTMVVAFFGVAIFTYVMSSATALASDEELKALWRRRKMDKAIRDLDGHYVVCGWSGVGRHIARELSLTGRGFVILAADAAEVARARQDCPGVPVLEGDVADDTLLQEAGIARAAGLFAAAEDDHVNIVVCLSARRLAPRARIVAAVQDARNAEKMRKAGADAPVSAVSIGGLRMASEMVRPTVVSFLDTMLRDQAAVLRVEEVRLAAAWAGRTVAELGLAAFPNSLLLAVAHDGGWVFHPRDDQRLGEGDVLVLMTTPAEREQLRERFGRA